MKFDEAYESIKLKFSSGNNISVERVTLLREEWDAIEEKIENLRRKNEK